MGIINSSWLVLFGEMALPAGDSPDMFYHTLYLKGEKGQEGVQNLRWRTQNLKKRHMQGAHAFSFREIQFSGISRCEEVVSVLIFSG